MKEIKKDIGVIYCDIINPIAMELENKGSFEKAKKELTRILSLYSKRLDYSFCLLNQSLDNVLENRFIVIINNPKKIMRLVLLLLVELKQLNLAKDNIVKFSIGINDMDIVSTYDLSSSVGKGMNYVKLANTQQTKENNSNLFRIHSDYFNINKFDYKCIDNFIKNLDVDRCNEVILNLCKEYDPNPTGNDDVDLIFRRFENFSFYC